MNQSAAPNARSQRARIGSRPRTRAAALAMVVALLAVVNLAVVATLRTGADSADRDTLGIETARAFYAAESGAVIAIRELGVGADLPEVGDTLELGPATVRFDAMPENDGVGSIEVEGVSGRGYRRVELTVE